MGSLEKSVNNSYNVISRRRDFLKKAGAGIGTFVLYSSGLASLLNLSGCGSSDKPKIIPLRYVSLLDMPDMDEAKSIVFGFMDNKRYSTNLLSSIKSRYEQRVGIRDIPIDASDLTKMFSISDDYVIATMDYTGGRDNATINFEIRYKLARDAQQQVEDAISNMTPVIGAPDENSRSSYTSWSNKCGVSMIVIKASSESLIYKIQLKRK